MACAGFSVDPCDVGGQGAAEADRVREQREGEAEEGNGWAGEQRLASEVGGEKERERERRRGSGEQPPALARMMSKRMKGTGEGEEDKKGGVSVAPRKAGFSGRREWRPAAASHVFTAFVVSGSAHVLTCAQAAEIGYGFQRRVSLFIVPGLQMIAMVLMQLIASLSFSPQLKRLIVCLEAVGLDLPAAVLCQLLSPSHLLHAFRLLSCCPLLDVQVLLPAIQCIWEVIQYAHCVMLQAIVVMRMLSAA